MNQPDFNTTKINETQNINQLNWAFLTLFLGIPLLAEAGFFGSKQSIESVITNSSMSWAILSFIVSMIFTRIFHLKADLFLFRKNNGEKKNLAYIRWRYSFILVLVGASISFWSLMVILLPLLKVPYILTSSALLLINIIVGIWYYKTEKD